MSLIGWLALGVTCGLFANLLADGSRASRLLDVALGVAGALGGGFMFLNFGGGQGFNIYSMVVAVAGAAAALLTYHALFVYPGDRQE